MVTLLCDADVLAYRAAIRNQKQSAKDGKFRIYANGNKAVKQVDEQIAQLFQKLDADRIIMALSHKDNFRKKVLPSYKEHRQKTLRPLALEFVREHLIDNYETLQLPGLEGDDVVGILATGEHYVQDEKILLSIDKDFNTIPATFYNLDKETISTASTDEADYYHMYQSLIGDSCDGYKGCPGIGPVKAKVILKDGLDWEKVVLAFVKAGQTAEDALVQARCARILRASDYDWEKREVRLWEPNQEKGNE